MFYFRAITRGWVPPLLGEYTDEVLLELGYTTAEIRKLQTDGVQVGFLAGGFLHWEADGLEGERG